MINRRLISFEGPEGSGKSTQIKRLSEKLIEMGEQVICVREPGGTQLGESIRQTLQSTDSPPLSNASELLLFMSSRAQLVNEVILPALQEGKWVLCDRFVDSSVAYQGYGRGEDIPLIERLNYYATQGLLPSLTILLELNVNTCFERLTRRYCEINGEKDRIESESIDFHQRVIDGYRVISSAEDRFKSIDGNQDPDVIADDVFQWTMKLRS